MYWYPGLQNLFGLFHIESFLQLTVQLFSPLPSHLEFFPLYFVSGWTWISMLHGYLWLGFFLHCLMSSVEISRLTGSWHFSEIYILSSGHLKKIKNPSFFFFVRSLIFFLIIARIWRIQHFLKLFKMNPTQHFKHKSGTRHVSTGFLLRAEHKQLSLIVFKHFILPHEFSIPQSSLSLQRTQYLWNPKTNPAHFQLI